jgi:radical SAM superfamily enzyme YgiQ (UPF0313 family)
MLYADLPPEVDQERGCYPPLGMLYVAGYARAHTSANIRILDMEADNIGLSDLDEVISKERPDVVGIQSITYTYIDTIQTARKIKEIDSAIQVVIGGVHATMYPLETVNNDCVDFVVNGEGELVFAGLINNINNREKLKHIKGLAFKDHGKIVDNGRSEVIRDLDALPFPARDLTPINKYFSVLAKRSPLTTMVSSKGCPNQCSFCDRPQLENRFRPRSPKSVVDEMEECIDMGISEFSLYDDTFTINKKRAIDICDEIIKRKLDIGWDARARVNTVDEELLKRMKKAGCDRLYIGVESGVPEILKIIKKNITLDQVKKAFKLTKKIKIESLAYIMIGLPTETREQILETIEFTKRLDADYVSFSIFTPMPCTEAYDNCLKRGIFKEDYWNKFAENPSTDFKPRLYEENMTEEELNELLKYAYRSYYLNPKFLMKRILNIRTLEQLKTQFRAGLSMFKLN